MTYEALASLEQLRNYGKALFRATKVSLQLLPPNEARRRANLQHSTNPFCALVAGTEAGCEACLEKQRCTEQSLAKNPSPHHACCFAGLTDIAIPVMVGDCHVATLLSGQIFRRKPLERDFDKAARMLEFATTGGSAAGSRIGKPADKGWVKRAREAYFSTPIIPKSSLEGIVQLLTIFAERLPDDAIRHLMASQPKSDPEAVKAAKEFIDAHSGENITLARVLQHVHVSRFHFCRIFKRATGITLTEYMARVRVEKAKELLLEPATRVSEIVFASGFGSIPQFNNVFKRCVGMSPTQYRARMQPRAAARARTADRKRP